MKKTYNQILKIFLWIGLLYISFMLIGCERSVTGTCELYDQYLFVEYNVLESWSGGPLIITDGPIYLFNDGVLDLKYTFPKPKIDNETKLLIGTRIEIARESGGGEVGNVKALALKNYHSTDTLPSRYFKNRVEILDCDNKGVITFKLNDQLFKLKPGETYTDTFTVRDFDMKGIHYNFLTDVVNIKHSGFIDKDKVIGL